MRTFKALIGLVKSAWSRLATESEVVEKEGVYSLKDICPEDFGQPIIYTMIPMYEIKMDNDIFFDVKLFSPLDSISSSFFLKKSWLTEQVPEVEAEDHVEIHCRPGEPSRFFIIKTCGINLQELFDAITFGPIPREDEPGTLPDFEERERAYAWSC